MVIEDSPLHWTQGLLVAGIESRSNKQANSTQRRESDDGLDGMEARREFVCC